MNTHDILVAARAKIADPQRWCQQRSALTASGAATGVKNGDAAMWCALGAVNAVTDSVNDAHPAASMLNKHARAIFQVPTITMVNDDLGHDAVLRVYAAAIAATAPAGEGDS